MNQVNIPTNYGMINITIREDSGSDIPIINEIFNLNVYKLHDNFFSNGGIVLDVGANIGIFTLNVLLRAKNNDVPVHIYAIEPEPHNLELLMQNLENNEWLVGDSRVTIVKEGINDKEGEAFIDDNHGGSRLSEEGSPITLITLDQFIEREKIEEVVFAKFDIEGSEVPAILAASDETIDKLARTAIEFDEQNGSEKFSSVINRFARKCQISTWGVPANGCYIYTERF